MKTASLTSAVGLALLVLTSALQADEFDGPPINYSAATPSNRVSRLVQRIEQGRVSLDGKTSLEVLRTLLRELEVPESSQTLVFSKTSLQRQKIAPRTPRAIYFSDDVYVGYCHGSELMEISAVDSQLGAVFYTVERTDDGQGPVELQRQGDNCLICHGSSQTRQVPGHLVRSVYVDGSGLPVLSMGSHRIDHTSEFRQRWGGWYVTGTHGDQTHLGNLIVRGERQPEQIDNAAGQNVTGLEKFISTDNYLTPHSDIVALMVLEHQTEGHNRITRAGFQCRMAMHQQQQLNKELGKPDDYLWDSTKSRIRSASEDLLKYLLFCEEAPLSAKVSGTSSFAQDFAALGPHDAQGRSLRGFDLERRMFKHPCSYLIYSEAFEALPAQVKDHLWQRLWEVVSEEDNSETFAHLSTDDRQAIREIVQATVQDLPEYWRQPLR